MPSLSTSSEPALRPKRLVSLDALRGFDLFWIAGADSIGHAALQIANGPVTHALADQLEHVAWEGFRFYDLIFPLFVFMSGLSLVLSLGGTIPSEKRTASLLKIGRRALLLYLLGLFYYRGGVGWENDFRYMGVLQRIALSYFGAGVLFVLLKPRQLLYTLVGILLGYWALIALVPVPGVGPANYKPGTNWAHWVDANFLGGKKWNGTHDPEGLLSTVPAIGSAILGVFAGLLMVDPSKTPTKRVQLLLSAGITLLLTGYLWGFSFPIIKGIWTSSYVCVAGGWSALLLALFYWLIDIRGWSGWAQPFIWIGMNSIAIYMACNLLELGRLAKRITGGEVSTTLDSFFRPGTSDLITALVAIGFCFALARLLHQRKIFLRI